MKPGHELENRDPQAPPPPVITHAEPRGASQVRADMQRAKTGPVNPHPGLPVEPLPGEPKTTPVPPAPEASLQDRAREAATLRPTAGTVGCADCWTRGRDAVLREVLTEATNKPDQPAAVPERVRTLKPEGPDLHDEASWNAGRDAALKAIEVAPPPAPETPPPPRPA